MNNTQPTNGAETMTNDPKLADVNTDVRINGLTFHEYCDDVELVRRDAEAFRSRKNGSLYAFAKNRYVSAGIPAPSRPHGDRVIDRDVNEVVALRRFAALTRVCTSMTLTYFTARVVSLLQRS